MADIAKANFTIACRQTASLLARVLGELRTQAATWEARGYAAEGTDPLTQEDLTGDERVADLTPENVAADINMAIQLAGTVGGAVGWIGTGSPTSESVVNVMRNDI